MTKPIPYRLRLMILGVVLFALWLGVLAEPAGLTALMVWLVVGGVLLGLALLLAGMGLCWLGFGLFALGDRVAGWVRRASGWPEA